MQRKIRNLIIFNSLILLALITYINPYHMYQCGHFGHYTGPEEFSASPEVGLGLHAYWWRNHFDLTDGRKLRAFNTPYDEPPKDPLVKGRESYAEITAYGISDSKDELFLKATDWHGHDKTYRAQMHPNSSSQSPLYQVTEYDGPNKVSKWIKVDYWSCRGGLFWFGPVSLVFLISIFSAIIVTLRGVFWPSGRQGQ